MHRQRRNASLRDRIERLRGRAGGRPTAPVRKRRVPRYEIEARRQRRIYWGMGIAAALSALILIVFAVNDYVIKPRHVLATVGNTEIRRRDYWKVRAISLIEEAQQYQQLATFVGPDQQQQYLQLAAQRLDEVDDVWGSTAVDEATLNRMIDDQVYLQSLDELGIVVTDEDVENYILQQFDPADAPILTPTPTPTLIPARAEMMTQTAVAEQTATAAALGPATPGPAPTSASIPRPPGLIATPVGGQGSPTDATPERTDSPLPAASPAASPLASPEASPGVGTPAPIPTVPPTPNPEQARATAQAGYQQYRENVFEQTHLSLADYERLIARPATAREKVDAAIANQVGQTAEQVHAAHILVETRDLAQQLYEQVTTGGADFGQVARENSTDEGTAGNGGDLGWFAREEMVAPFAEVAFALPPGQVSEPFETEFGWHIVKVIAKEPDRPLTEEQITKIEQARVDRWLEEQREKLRIDSELEPTPTPFAEEFQPPAQAPPAPTPTPAPPPASPAPAGGASPIASPVEGMATVAP